jgi:hypothetical protein
MRRFLPGFVHFVHFALLLALAGSAFAQGGFHQDYVLQSGGLANATVTVCTAAATGSPCSPTAVIYTDQTLSTQATNPFLTDGFGNFSFYAPPGFYKVSIGATGISTFTQTVLVPPDANNAGYVTLSAQVLTAASAGCVAASGQAQSGDVRLCNSTTIKVRNQANSADQIAWSWNSDNTMNAGDTAGVVFLGPIAPAQYNFATLSGLAPTRFTIASCTDCVAGPPLAGGGSTPFLVQFVPGTGWSALVASGGGGGGT